MNESTPAEEQLERERYAILAQAFERAEREIIDPARQRAAELREPIRCIWCGRTREDHQAICYPDGSESTEGNFTRWLKNAWPAAAK